MEKKQILKGFAIVIADRGWVYVGEIEIDDQFCNITNCKNIRRWGTTAGLGELAKNGPTSETKLDDYGSVYVPVSNCQIIESKKELWS